MNQSPSTQKPLNLENGSDGTQHNAAEKLQRAENSSGNASAEKDSGSAQRIPSHPDEVQQIAATYPQEAQDDCLKPHLRHHAAHEMQQAGVGAPEPAHSSENRSDPANITLHAKIAILQKLEVSPHNMLLSETFVANGDLRHHMKRGLVKAALRNTARDAERELLEGACKEMGEALGPHMTMEEEAALFAISTVSSGCYYGCFAWWRAPEGERDYFRVYLQNERTEEILRIELPMTMMKAFWLVEHGVTATFPPKRCCFAFTTTHVNDTCKSPIEKIFGLTDPTLIKKPMLEAILFHPSVSLQCVEQSEWLFKRAQHMTV
jgi:hypothetical protein